MCFFTFSFVAEQQISLIFKIEANLTLQHESSKRGLRIGQTELRKTWSKEVYFWVINVEHYRIDRADSNRVYRVFGETFEDFESVGLERREAPEEELCEMDLLSGLRPLHFSPKVTRSSPSRSESRAFLLLLSVRYLMRLGLRLLSLQTIITDDM